MNSIFSQTVFTQMKHTISVLQAAKNFTQNILVCNQDKYNCEIWPVGRNFKVMQQLQLS